MVGGNAKVIQSYVGLSFPELCNLSDVEVLDGDLLVSSQRRLPFERVGCDPFNLLGKVGTIMGEVAKNLRAFAKPSNVVADISDERVGGDSQHLEHPVEKG